MRGANLLLPLLALSCAKDAPEEAPFVPLAPPEHGYQYTLQATVHPGEERFFCRWIQMPSSLNVITRVQSQYTTGSHHFLLYKTDPEDLRLPVTAPPREDTFDCSGSESPMKYVRGVVFGTQSAEAEMTFPPGVAMQLKGGTVLLLQSHYINPGTTPLDVTVRVNLEVGALADVQQEAGTLLFYNIAAYVPPMANGATSTLSCPINRDSYLLGAGSHMHKRGAGYKAEAILPSGAREMLYETNDWADPAPARFPAPGKLLPAGTRIEYTCTWKNNENREYFQGNSATENEMCMFAAAYYPRLPMLDEFCYGGRIVGSGTASCGASFACLRGCADNDCAVRCVSNSCPSTGGTGGPVRACARSNCYSECLSGMDIMDIGYTGATCGACIESKCTAQVDACTAHACGG